ncbi:MAG: hypothetical protein IJ093_01445 [Bacilli bacterium]|nr:hypothetical protein [Bacilli bacterium]
MRKKLLFLLVCFCLCGCSAEYNLTINANEFEENVFVYIPYEEIPIGVDFSNSNNKISVLNSKDDYNYNVSENENGYVEQYSYKHVADAIKNSYFISNCYGNSSITQTENNIIIKTADRFNCIVGDDGFYVEQVKVNITTDLKVLSNNADEINGNTYTWIFDESNYQNKPINMTIQKKNVVQRTMNNFLTTFVDAIKNNYLVFILAVIIVLGTIIYVYISKKQKENNDI